MEILSFLFLTLYCDMTRTLIAWFSNNDTKKWMEDSGWKKVDGRQCCDKSVGVGYIADPSVNADMLSPAFWLVKGRQFKFTHSDRHSERKSPLMLTLEMIQFGQAMAAMEIVLFNMEISFKQPMDSDKLRAMGRFNTQHKSVSGATGMMVIERRC